MKTANRTVVVTTRSEWSDDLDGWESSPPIVVPDRVVFHWSPSARRSQIIRYGLRPRMRHTLHSDGWRASYICFGDSPSWAWALSGGMGWAPTGEWDLWQTWLSDLGPDVGVIPDATRQSGMYEIRTPDRVYKSRLWYVGSRTKATS